MCVERRSRGDHPVELGFVWVPELWDDLPGRGVGGMVCLEDLGGGGWIDVYGDLGRRFFPVLCRGWVECC